MTKQIKITTDQSGQRLDKFLTKKLGLSRSQIQKLIKQELVLVNDQKTNVHHFLKESEKITITKNKPQTADNKLPATSREQRAAANHLPKFDLKIIAQTPDYLIVNKPASIPVHPDNRYKTGTLIQKVASRFPNIKKVGEDKSRPGVVHRLDKDVSGLVVVAKNKKMFDHLKNQFSNRLVQKKYIALANGYFTPESGEINFPIARSKNGLMVARSTGQDGKPAITNYQVTKYYINYSLVEAYPKTGRTHQIRVHFKALGHPLVGDTIYKIKKQKPEKHPLDRIFLHAQTLGFYDLRQQWQEFTCPLPIELEDYLKQLKPTVNKQ
ncbi:MAG: RluA family pseudouridine synthase [Patescibacteria group bacterium]